MLRELRFVQGAVAKKDLMPAMTHFRIEGGFVRAYNGVLALCSPIAFDIDCVPHAEKLVKAISNCKETPVLSMSPNGRLRLQSGPYKAFIECVEGETPHVQPQGEVVNFDGEVLLKAMQVISPFIGNDASRPWTNGVLLRGQSAFATNNVCLIEYWLGTEVPFVVNIPGMAVREMLRVNEPPTHAQIHENSLTLHYTDGRWIRTQLLETTWPDIGKILSVESNPSPIDPRLFEALEALSNMSDSAGRVYMRDGVLQTHDSEAEAGASYEVAGLGIEGAYQINMLKLLDGVATHADFTRYPNPTLFFGERLRGAIIGMRM